MSHVTARTIFAATPLDESCVSQRSLVATTAPTVSRKKTPLNAASICFYAGRRPVCVLSVRPKAEFAQTLRLSERNLIGGDLHTCGNLCLILKFMYTPK